MREIDIRRYCKRFLNVIIKKNQRRRAQVFILATLLIVVYGVSIITVITEFSIRNQINTERQEVNDILNEFLEEMTYQLQVTLFNETTGGISTTADLIAFQRSFERYAALKGVQATFTFRPSDFNVFSTTSLSLSPQVIIATAQTTVNLLSTKEDATIVGTFLHFYGIEVLISSTNDVITIREINSHNETIQYISNIQSVLVDAAPATSTSLNNGTHLLSAPIIIGLQFTLDNGIVFLATP